MEKQQPLNVWIYSRVSNRSEADILSFQSDLLYKFAKEKNYYILGLTSDYDDGISLHSNIIQPLINAIVSEFINAIVVYSKDRLLCDIDTYTEFELLCLMHNVSIITYDDYL